jgi:hypothetical protein
MSVEKLRYQDKQGKAFRIPVTHLFRFDTLHRQGRVIRKRSDFEGFSSLGGAETARLDRQIFGTEVFDFEEGVGVLHMIWLGDRSCAIGKRFNSSLA